MIKEYFEIEMLRAEHVFLQFYLKNNIIFALR